MHKLTKNDEKNKNMKTIKKEEEQKYDEETEERRARPSLTARTGPVTLSSTEEQQKRVAARATAAMAQVLRRRPRSMMMWGRKKVVIKTYPDGGQEILVPQTLTAEQQQYEFPPRSRFLKKLATSNETEEKRRFSNPPQPFGNTPDQLALNEWFSKTLSNATKSESNNNNNNRNWVKRTSYKRKKSSEFIQLKSDAGKKWAHTLSTLEPPTEDCSTHYVPKKLLKCSPTTGNSVTTGAITSTDTTKTIRSRSSLRHLGTTTTTIVSDINTIWKEYHKRSELSKSTTLSSSISSTKTHQSVSRGRKVYDNKIMVHHSSANNTSISSGRIRRGTISMNNSISNSNLSQYRTNSSQNMSRNMNSSSNNNNNNSNNNSSGSSRKGSKNTKINSNNISSNSSSSDRSRSSTRNENNDNSNDIDHNSKKSTPITGMVQLIGLLHHSLKEQQQRSIDRMEKLEYLLLDERKQREQAEYRKDQTMKKFELMYQQLHDHIENTKENLLIGEYPAPPSYQSLLMEKVSSSLSGLEQSIERHQQQLKKRQSLTDHPLKKMSTPLSMSNQRRMVALRQ